MRVIGLDGMSNEQINYELQRGGKFVIYQYCISVILLTFKQPSNIYFIRSDQNAVVRGLGFSALSLVLGWWGFPWGPIYTVGSLATNFAGGKDVTDEILASMQ